MKYVDLMEMGDVKLQGIVRAGVGGRERIGQSLKLILAVYVRLF